MILGDRFDLRSKEDIMQKLLYFSLLFILFSACNKDNNDVADVANVTFAFDMNINGQPIEYGTVYDLNGTAISFDIASFYVGGLELTLDNGSVIDFANNYLLADLGNSFNVNNSFEVAAIQKAKFFIGVDSVTNSQTEMDFTQRPTSDPLGIQDPSMHWNWNTGYKFLRVDGDVDTDGDGTVDTGVAYHLGSNALLKSFDMPLNIQLERGANTLYFSLDLQTLFNGVDVSTELDTHTGNNLPLAMRLHDNLGAAISLRK